MKKLLAILALVSMLSCGVHTTPSNPESYTSNIPALNTTNKTEIGITLVTKESGYKYEAIKILKTLEVRMQSGKRSELKKGDVYIQDLDTKKYNLYSNPYDSSLGIAIPESGGKALIYFNSPTGINTFNIRDEIEFEKTFAPVTKKEYFKQEFIYNGRVGNALKFIYREYADDLARSAFTQDLQYDLTESKTIGFRGLRIEVISATNTIIEYKLLNQFSK
jgi:hypothetical protein